MFHRATHIGAERSAILSALEGGSSRQISGLDAERQIKGHIGIK
ncbi:hypothetical protein CAMGR0001_1076 [Campylobacter gracilis RM3268]|uniref:Uncharacterized protein n=2 Tax=Campylobacter gracilis TaxID=824 RepID=C8PGT1_9BACT|nr:hypothetical protein CAMGR0001_1076 [Campylobacter gracilis RM3268]